MDLKTFVSETLVQIAEGIKEAQNKTHDTGAIISPRMASERQAANQYIEARHTESVEFDVALTVSSKENTGSGGFEATIGVAIASIGLKSGNTQNGDAIEHVSRIKFTVPVRWPSIENVDNGYERKVYMQDSDSTTYERGY